MYPIKALATTTVPCLDVLKISVGTDVGSSTPRPARRVGSANSCSSASDRLQGRQKTLLDCVLYNTYCVWRHYMHAILHITSPYAVFYSGV